MISGDRPESLQGRRSACRPFFCLSIQGGSSRSGSRGP